MTSREREPRSWGTWVAFLALVLRVSSTAAAGPSDRTIRFRVVEVAGGRAYIDAGEDAHLKRGDTVAVAGRRYTVVAVSGNSALIAMKRAALRVGQRGHARVTPASSEQVTRLRSPESLAGLEGQWPRAVLPASRQKPNPVPLGVPVRRDAGRTDLAVSLAGAGVFPLEGTGESLGRGALRVRLRTEPFPGVPLSFDTDLAAQMWLASDLGQRNSGGSRPPASVYALAARYGDPVGLHAAAGRLRYAASGLGMLDGLRVQAPALANVRVAAFGGLVPQPLDGLPDPDTARFGGELVYEDLESSLRPRVSVTAHGSRFAGETDERRVQLQADVFPDRGYAGGYTLVSFFDADNPWNAPRSEVTAAGAHAGVYFGKLHAGARFDMQRPERSLWLEDFLPSEWLCVTQPAPSSLQPEACYGDEAHYQGQANVGLRFERAAVDVGATVSRTAHLDADQQGGFAHLRLLRVLGRGRADVTVSGSYGDVLRTLALTVAPGMAFGEVVDATLRYRPAVSRYRVDTGYFLEHTVGANLRLSLRSDVDIGLNSDLVYGRDVRVVLAQVITTWRL